MLQQIRLATFAIGAAFAALGLGMLLFGGSGLSAVRGLAFLALAGYGVALVENHVRWLLHEERVRAALRE